MPSTTRSQVWWGVRVIVLLGSGRGRGASSAPTEAASLAMERVVILPLRRPWLLAVLRPRGVFCSFPSSSSPPSHLSLSLPRSLKGERQGQIAYFYLHNFRKVVQSPCMYWVVIWQSLIFDIDSAADQPI